VACIIKLVRIVITTPRQTLVAWQVLRSELRSYLDYNTGPSWAILIYCFTEYQDSSVIARGVYSFPITANNSCNRYLIFSIEFSVYLPDLLDSGSGGADRDVETVIVEPSEPIDVRRNRQLTLDNMRLNRELVRI